MKGREEPVRTPQEEARRREHAERVRQAYESRALPEIAAEVDEMITRGSSREGMDGVMAGVRLSDGTIWFPGDVEQEYVVLRKAVQYDVDQVVARMAEARRAQREIQGDPDA